MTTQPSATVVGHADIDPGNRGSTTLGDRVVEKIAARAALEVPHCTGIPRSLVGITTGGPAVHADAVIDGSLARLSLRLGVEYPAPVTRTTRQVRGHVIDAVQRMCGLTVDHIDITVAAVARPHRKEKRVL